MRRSVSYRVRNWSKYNKALVRRGDIQLWISDDVLAAWHAPKREGFGRPQIYSDQCILLALTLQALFSLTLRMTQGFLGSLLALMRLRLPVPDYTSMCRRRQDLDVSFIIDKIRAKKGAVDLVVDATGLKVYGEGEWKVRVHGKGKRRTWCKLHLAMDADNFQIRAMELTASKVSEGNCLPVLAEQVGEMGDVYADAAYMSQECFDIIADKGGRAVIDVKEGTALARETSRGLRQRNRLLRETWASGGKKRWLERSGYHRRSLIETQIGRWKKMLGGTLSSRKMTNQKIEARIKAMILNQLTALGMPKSETVLI